MTRLELVCSNYQQFTLNKWALLIGIYILVQIAKGSLFLTNISL